MIQARYNEVVMPFIWTRTYSRLKLTAFYSCINTHTKKKKLAELMEI